MTSISLRCLSPSRVLGRIVLIALLAALPLTTILVGTFVKDRNHALADTTAALDDVVRDNAIELTGTLSTLTQVLMALGTGSGFEQVSTGECPARLSAIYRYSSRYRDLYVANAQGEIVCLAEFLDVTVNIVDRDYFKAAMKSLDPVLGDIVISRITNRAVVPVALALRNADGRAAGVVAGNIDIGSYLERAASRYAHEGIVLTLWDAKGRVLARHPGIDALTGTTQADAPLFQAIQRSAGRSSVTEAIGLDGVERLYALAPISYGQRQLWISAGAEASESFASANAAFAVNFGIAAIGLASVLFIAAAIGDFSLRRPITRLSRAASQVAAGEHGVRTGIEAGAAEIVELSANFDRMADELERRLETQARTNEELSMAKASIEEKVAQRTRELEQASTTAKAQASTLAETADELAALSEMTDLLQTIQEPGAAGPVVCNAMDRLFPGNTASVFLFRESRNLVEPMGGHGGADTPASFNPADCLAIRLGHSYRVDHGAPKARCAHIADHTAGYACVPMSAHGEVIGVLSLSLPGDRATSDATMRLAGLTAERLSLALANVKLRQQLHDISIHDSLTGLYNRRYMEDILARELYRAKREKTSLCVLMLDLDHFKKFNDTYGHQAGDMALQHVGELLRSSFRGSDVCCRYGGEELLVILPNSDPAAVLGRANQLREDMKKIAFAFNGALVGDISVSIGMASYPDPIADGDTLIAAADAALYEAKAAGRDRVCVATARNAKAA